MRRNRIKVPFQVLRYPAQPWSPRALSWPLTDPCRTLVVDPSLAVRLPPAHPGSSLENTTAPHPPTGPHHSPQHPPLPGGCPCVLVLCSLSPARRSRPSQRLRQTGPVPHPHPHPRPRPHPLQLSSSSGPCGQVVSFLLSLARLLSPPSTYTVIVIHARQSSSPPSPIARHTGRIGSGSQDCLTINCPRAWKPCKRRGALARDKFAWRRPTAHLPLSSHHPVFPSFARQGSTPPTSPAPVSRSASCVSVLWPCLALLLPSPPHDTTDTPWTGPSPPCPPADPSPLPLQAPGLPPRHPPHSVLNRPSPPDASFHPFSLWLWWNSSRPTTLFHVTRF